MLSGNENKLYMLVLSTTVKIISKMLLYFLSLATDVLLINKLNQLINFSIVSSKINKSYLLDPPTGFIHPY